MALQLHCHPASLLAKKAGAPSSSLLSSVQSNGGCTLTLATSITCKKSKKTVQPLHVVCSVPSEGAAAKTTNAETRSAPAGVVLGRSSFPPSFAFGTATAAYQVEGAWNEGGRGPSIWDTFTHEQPNKIRGENKTGDQATDSYRKYKEDIQLMKQMGVDSYRFSISWSRILPDGTKKGGVNKEGVAYYNNLINELLKNGITPFVTMFHWDVPQALEDKYNGFRCEHKEIVDDFKEYAKILFQLFGDRVKHWITLNEPWSFSSMGYSLGKHAPGRCTKDIAWLGCPAGDSLTEPYIVTHNLILAHGAAARLYKDHFQHLQRGEIGITNVSMWFEPFSNSYEDKDATQRSLDFMLGWFMDPLAKGDYPFIMRALLRDRLPYFTEEESEMIKGSYDFIGLNYYTSRYIRAVPMNKDSVPQFSIIEAYSEQLQERNGAPIGKLTGSWINVVPIGMRNLLVYTKNRYNNPKIYITENGTAQLDHDKTLSREAVCADEERTNYMALHLAQIQEAIREGVDVKGYFAWSFADNFEWNEGYTERFGLHYIDYDDDFKRYPKASSGWYTRFLKS